ncbi:MAG: GvpL/GvpF family gas vesicle protein [Acidobacteria bacterium]|nr:GvpL/GvpF family gas vesicle protein [Acidobacteriota bacterium]
MAIYTYCLLRLSTEESLPDLKGIDARPVFPLRCDRYTMLVSRLERDFVFSARSIAEHGQVIARIFENKTVLPMRFGTLFRSEKQVIDLVRENRQDLLEAFCRLRGKAEMRVKLLLGFPALASSSKAADIRKPPGRALHSEESLPAADSEPLDPQCRELAAQLSVRLREMFHPLEQQVTCRRLDGSQLLVDCAHLIEANTVEAYQKLFCQASGQVKDCDLRVSGPWPPYHFLPSAVRLPAAVAAPPLRSRLGLRVAAAAR